MRKPKAIQITLPEPCHEDWDEMTPVERGRFCSRCQKTVIDFTKWTDEALLNFFLKDKNKTCGRFTTFQLDRNITVPPEPPGMLYRIAIALGLTSIFTQIPYMANAQHRVSKHISATKKSQNANKKELSKPVSGIKGTIIAQDARYIAGAQISLYDDKGILINIVKSDVNGCYTIDDIPPCTYKITVHGPVTYPATSTTNNILVNINKYTELNVHLMWMEIEPHIITTGGAPITMTIADYIHQRRYWRRHPWKFVKRKLLKIKPL